jgi:hypothetical protein
VSSLPARAPQTRALRDWLTFQCQFPIGYGKAPEDVPIGWTGAPGMSDYIGYGVLHTIPGGELDGDLVHPSSDGDLPWQVDAVGGSEDQADTIADDLQAALLGQRPPLEIDGRTLLWIRCDVPHGGARQDPDQPSIWRSVGLYRVGTTPTT